MRSLMTGSHTTDLLYEATLESLKNMLLVMDSVKVIIFSEYLHEIHFFISPSTSFIAFYRYLVMEIHTQIYGT